MAQRDRNRVIGSIDTYLRLWFHLFDDRLRLLRLLRTSNRWTVAPLLVCGFLGLTSPALFALANGWLVQRIQTSYGTSAGLSAVLGPLVILSLLLVFTQIAESGQEAFGQKAAREIDGRVRTIVRETALLPRGIAHLESEDFHNDLTRASDLGGNRGRVRSPGTAVLGQVTLTLRVLTALAAAALVARYSVPLAIALFTLSLISRLIVRRQWMFLTDVDSSRTGAERRMEYWAELLSGTGAAKEVRLFGLGQWLGDRRRSATVSWLEVFSKERRRVMKQQGPIIVIGFLSAALAFGVPGYYATAGAFSAADAVTCLFAGWSVLGLSAMGHEAFDIEYGLGAVRSLDRVTAAVRQLPGAAGGGEAVPVTPFPPSVSFRDIGFTYPGSAHAVLNGLNLDLRPGEVLAIIGHNGAGKTTLMKLLGGLHVPIHGSVTVEGRDLLSFDSEDWRRRLTSVFQDFNRYPLTLRENIALSAPEVNVLDAAVLSAIHRAGADHLLTAMPEVLDTMLWKGARELSSGQWQHVAIARALYAVDHGRQIVVLDEPTSHLDVAAEAEFFDRIVAAARGASIVLISHRLSTTRNADRIVVLEAGRIVEEGTHQQLMERAEGRYARLFQVQASRFREPEESAAW